MTLGRRLAVSLVAACSVSFSATPSDACSCIAPTARMLSPGREAPAPLNTRVRVVLPSHYGTGVEDRVQLRKPGGEVVPVTRRKSATSDQVFLELVPEAPLSPATRYEVALRRTDHRPSTLVFGTFVTSDALDTRPPVGGKLGTPRVFKANGWSGASCGIGTPWAEIDVPPTEDPDRERARLLYAVWLPSASGKVDPRTPPTAYLEIAHGKLVIGKTSLCDPDDFPLPARGQVNLGLALVDEAGNFGKLARVALDIGRAKSPWGRK